MTAPEFSRPIKARNLPAGPALIAASPTERAALARRFGLTAVEDLRATVELEQEAKAVHASGRLTARIIQTCAISLDDFATEIAETLAFRFVAETSLALAIDDEIEIELSSGDLDEIEYSGDTFDLGEAVAQSLGLAINPYAEGPNANAARRLARLSSDEEPSSPLAEALKAVK